MKPFDYNTDQVKYYTQISEYEYKRPTPDDPTPTINPQAMITLPLPTNMPNDAYNAVVREFDGGELRTAFDLLNGEMASSAGERGSSMGFSFNGGGSGASSGATLQEKLTGGALAAVGAYAVFKGTTKIADLAGATAFGLQPVIDFAGSLYGKARNPHTAMVFDRMGMRHFDLQFLLSPRSKPQADRLNEMLRYLRAKMHPSFMKDNRFVLEYPSMFSIKFPNMENIMGIPSVDYSFLKSMSINASPQGQVFYKDGQPTFVEVRMEFVELDMKTRGNFESSDNA